MTYRPPIRLRDLGAKFVNSASGARGIGVEFRCPCPQPCAVGGGFAFVRFANALDGSRRNGWKRTGETIDDLTLSGHIYYPGHWSGRISAGNLVVDE